MKRSTGLSTGRSNYKYGAKKNPWKWTGGKIAAFSAFGILVAALIYIESRSDTTTLPATTQLTGIGTTEPAVTEFDKEYQQFLKQGKKIVSEKTLDSLEKLNSAPIDQPVNTSSNSNATPSRTPQNTVSNRSLQRKNTPPDNDNSSSNSREGVENNLNPVPLLPSGNRQSASKQIIGSLEEVEPSEQVTAVNTSPAGSSNGEDEVITEEFYTEETISGVIAAASDRTPISGVTISVKGTKIKTVSGPDGNYSITVPGDPQLRTILYSYQGNSTERDVSPGTKVMNVRF